MGCGQIKAQTTSFQFPYRDATYVLMLSFVCALRKWDVQGAGLD